VCRQKKKDPQLFSKKEEEAEPLPIANLLVPIEKGRLGVKESGARKEEKEDHTLLTLLVVKES